MADKRKIELQVTIATTSDEILTTGNQPPPNTAGRSHDLGYGMGSVLCVEVKDDKG